MIREIALITILSALLSAPAQANVPKNVEREVFQELLGSVERLKMDLDGYQIDLSHFLSRNILCEPYVTFSVQNHCSLRNGPDDYTCKITLKKYASPPPKKARKRNAFRVDYLAVENAYGQVDMYPWSLEYQEIVAKHVPPEGFERMDTDFERQAFKALLLKAPEISVQLARSRASLTELFTTKMLTDKPYTVSFRNRCYARTNSGVYQCGLTAVVYQWYKRNPARLQKTFTLEYNAGGSQATGVALPGRFKSVTYQ